jgi:hypothetical protein
MSSLNKIENSQRSQSSALPRSDYMPQHPLYTLKPEPITIDNDHLYNYVETRPFEKSEPRKARNRNVEIEKLTKEIGKMKRYDYNRLRMGLREKYINLPKFDGKETSLSPENIEIIKGLMKEKTENIKSFKEVMEKCTKETVEQKKKLQEEDKKHLSGIAEKYLRQMSDICAMYENNPRSRTTEKIEFIEREIEELLFFFEKLKLKKKITKLLQEKIDKNVKRVKELENEVRPWHLAFADFISNEPRQQPIHEDSEWSLCVIT